MHSAIRKMMEKYPCHNIADYTHALKEIIQEVALLGLWRAKFFERAAFYGGTALRILYGLDRFSDDLDFSLLKMDKKFSLEKYNEAVQQELLSFGFMTKIEVKEKQNETQIQSAFIKADTKQQLIHVLAPDNIVTSIHHQQKIKIKMEVDTDPPQNFETETKTLFQPIPFVINTFKQPSLFAGKVHALLCRAWQKRLKGRDWYDFVWYVSNNIPLDLLHLQARLQQSGHWPKDAILSEAVLLKLLKERIASLDISLAQKDVSTYLTLAQQASIEIWSRDFFNQVVNKLVFVH